MTIDIQHIYIYTYICTLISIISLKPLIAFVQHIARGVLDWRRGGCVGGGGTGRV